MSYSSQCINSVKTVMLRLMVWSVMNWKGLGRKLPWFNRGTMAEFVWSNLENRQNLYDNSHCPNRN
jgi:hypothetical protein